MTDKEKKSFIDKHITDIYPQLLENVKKVCGAGYSKWGDDLLPLSLEFFLNKPLDVQYESCKNNKAENFITFIMNFQLKSSTTRFWHVWRKHKNSHREIYPDSYLYDETKVIDNEDDDLMLCIKQHIKDLDPFEKMLVEERVLKGMRFVDIAERYDIPYTALSNQLSKTLKKIKKSCLHLK
jgi:hypothetical protein